MLWRTIEAQPHGYAEPAELTLTYRLIDPCAIGLKLAMPGEASRSWSAARRLIRDGLDPDRVPRYDGEPAAQVRLSRPPGDARCLLQLKSLETGRSWSLVVATAPLLDFLALTIQACPAQREARIVAKELEVQLGMAALIAPPARRKGRKRPRM